MFQIRFSEDAERHLRSFKASDRRLIIAAIRQHLTHQPTVPTRNRKLLRANPRAAWELRVQRFRVLYNVEEEDVTVLVIAIAEKDGNRYVVDGEVFPPMNTIAIETERRPIAELLPTGENAEPIILTRDGRKEYMIVPFDEGDEEACAARNSAAFMAYLDRCLDRAEKGPTKSLDEIEAALDDDA